MVVAVADCEGDRLERESCCNVEVSTSTKSCCLLRFCCCLRGTQELLLDLEGFKEPGSVGSAIVGECGAVFH